MKSLTMTATVQKEIFVSLLILSTSVMGTVVDFESFALPPESHYGGTGSGMSDFVSHGITFVHSNDNYSWNGFSYSNETDVVTGDYTNEFSAIAGKGVDGSDTYGVGALLPDWASLTYDILPIRLSFQSPAAVSGMYITNTTYTYWTMKNGNFFANAFGGQTGNDPDYLKVIIRSFDLEKQIPQQVEFFLSDYRFDNDYLVDDWRWVDLSSLGTVSYLEFSIEGSDVGDYGLNTPAYFAFDGLTFVPEPATLLLVGLGVALLKKHG